MGNKYCTLTSYPDSSFASLTAVLSGFSPNSITINKRDTVTFINNADTKTWPASNVHPTHTIYPNSDIKKCGTSVEDSIFDACHGLEKGETYSFTFNEVGSWQYHDHFSSSKNIRWVGYSFK